jgi:hypothetical protein
MMLLDLAREIEEQILFLDAGDARFVPELTMRRIAHDPRWDRQRGLFEQVWRRRLVEVNPWAETES